MESGSSWAQRQNRLRSTSPHVCECGPENSANRPSSLQTQRWPWACYTFHNFQTTPTLFSGKTASASSHDIPKKGTGAWACPDCAIWLNHWGIKTIWGIAKPVKEGDSSAQKRGSVKWRKPIETHRASITVDCSQQLNKTMFHSVTQCFSETQHSFHRLKTKADSKDISPHQQHFRFTHTQLLLAK